MPGQQIAQGPEPTYDKIVSGYQTFHHPNPLQLDWGGSLPGFDIAYETWGELSPERDNAVLRHTGRAASSHAKVAGGDQPAADWLSGFARRMDFEASALPW